MDNGPAERLFYQTSRSCLSVRPVRMACADRGRVHRGCLGMADLIGRHRRSHPDSLSYKEALQGHSFLRRGVR